MPQLFSQPGAQESQGPPDFFLFIKDYSWSLRYRISRMADAALDMQSPLQLDWVKLKRPVRDPNVLLTKPSAELFDWNTIAPAMHKGFKYHVLGTIGSNVEGVIKFLEGKGPSFMVGPDTGIEIVDRGEARRQARDAPSEDPADGAGQGRKHVSHCWVQCLGMPLLPVIQSISFYDAHEVVLHWQA